MDAGNHLMRSHSFAVSQARVQFDMLNHFVLCWPVDEMAKAFCKRRRLQIYKKERLTAQAGTHTAAFLAAMGNAEDDVELLFNGP